MKVLIRIFLFKGTHHYINCINRDEVTSSISDDSEWIEHTMAILCFNIT